MNEQARVRARAVHGGCVVEVEGEVDMANARQVFDRVAALVQSQASVVILDLSATDYLDSSGIAMVFRLAERLRVGRQELRLVVPTTARIRPVIDLTAVARVVQVYSTVAEGSPTPQP